MIDIILLQLDHDDSTVCAYYDALSLTEQQRAQGFRHADDRSRFVVTRATLRAALARRLGVAPTAVALTTAARGKPVLDEAVHSNARLHFNVSHAGAWAAIAMAAYPVGVDIEQVRDLDIAAVAAQVFDPATCQRIACDAHARDVFFREWTLHEAQWKASGVGLAGAQSRRAGESLPVAHAQVLPLAVAPGYFGAVCVLGAPDHCRATDIHITACRAADMLAQVNP